MLANWVTKMQHDEIVKLLKEDIVSSESQLAAIRMDMDMIRNNVLEVQMDVASGPDTSDGEKENKSNPSDRRTLDISDDRKLALMSMSPLDEKVPNIVVVPPRDSSACVMCPKYQVKVAQLKKYLEKAIEKLKFQSDQKSRNDHHIQMQLRQTESFLAKARANMETFLYNRADNAENVDESPRASTNRVTEMVTNNLNVSSNSYLKK